MPTTYKRKLSSIRGNWSRDDLLKAIEAINKELMGVNEAAKYFNIPQTTLKRRIKTNDFSKGFLGPSSILGQENERKMLHIKKLQAHGFIPSRDNVCSMAFDLAQQLNIKHNFNMESRKAGYDWLTSFLTRNVDLSIRKAEGISVNRTLGMNKEVVAKYFELLENILIKSDLINKPGSIFNADESGF